MTEITLESLIQEALEKGFKESGDAKTQYVIMSNQIDEIMKIFKKELPETVILTFENFPKHKSTIKDLLDSLLNIKKGRNAR